MWSETNHVSRRTFGGLAALMTTGWVGGAEPDPRTKVSLFDGHTLDGWIQIENNATSLSSGGIIDPAGRGVIYTEKDYGRYRLTFTMRHVSGNPDHQACVLIFCTRPQAEEKPLDALGGIQFQVPKGGHWDYRPGMNNSGGAEFASITKPQFDVHAWSRVEIPANAANRRARMAVAQSPEAKAVEVLAFEDPSAGKVGPIAWQMHNAD